MTEKNVTDDSRIRRNFSQHAFSALLAALIYKGLSLVLLKMLTVLLTKEEFGYYSVWLAFVILISTYSTGAFSSTLWRYLPRMRKDKESKAAARLVTSSFFGSLIVLSSAVLVALGAFFLFGFQVVESPEYVLSLVVVIALGIIYLTKEIILVISGTEQNAREIISFSLAYGIVAYSCAILVAYLFRNHFIVIIGLVIGYSIPLIASLVFKLKQYGVSIPRKTDFTLAFRFGGPNIVVSAVKALVPFFIYFYIGFLIGIEEVANFVIAFAVASLFSFAITPPQNAYRSYMVNAYEADIPSVSDDTPRKIVELFLILAVPATYLMIELSPIVIQILSTAEYLSAAIVVPFTVLSTVIVALSYFWSVQLELKEKPVVTGAIYLCSAFVLIGMSIFLLPIWGIFGIGVALICQALTVFVMMIVIVTKELPISFSGRFFGAWGLAVVIMVILHYVLFSIGVHLVVILLTSCLIYLIVLNRSHIVNKQVIKEYLNFFRGR